MRKKIGNYFFAAVLLVSVLVLGGCGADGAENNNTKSPVAGQETLKPEDVTSPQPTESPEADDREDIQGTDKQEEVKPEETKEPFVADRSRAFELLSHINVGWNLGNTLDAHGAGNSLRSETYWGNPKTTQEMIDAVKAQGFNAIRIPVTYAEHVSKDGTYTINQEWLDRVQEVVDYAVNADMYILLNTHHETDYWLKPDMDHEEEAIAELTAIWTQVAQRFKDYDEKLMFEGMNEPRIKGSASEWNGGSPGERRVVYQLNQAFVDAVRATGGNNTDRLLVICTYGNNANYDIIKELKIPEDNNIAVALHMYTPYYFTYDAEGGYSNWDGSQKASLISSLKQIDKYLIKKDVPVMITEFGAVNKNNTKDVIAWIEDYLGSMNTYGIKCFWWDNNIYDTDGEKFGIFNRRELSWYNQEIADALIQNAECAE